MPPKGKGRGRGAPRTQDQGQQQPRPPSGQQQQPTGRGGGPPPGRPSQGQPGIAAQPPRPSQNVPPQRDPIPPERQPGVPPGFRQQAPPPERVSTSAPEPPPSAAGARPKPRPVDPQEVGLEIRHKPLVEPALPPKPSPGRLGRPIKLISNCLKVQLPSGNVYHYDVEIINKGRSMTSKDTPPATKEEEKNGKKKDAGGKKYRCMSTKRNREIVNLMVETNDKFRGQFPAYDGRKNLYTRKQLNIPPQGFKCNVIIEDDENPGNPNDPRGRKTESFEVNVKPVQRSDTGDCAISLDPLHALFAGQVGSVSQDAVMAIETILRHGPCKRFFPVARSFFYPPAPQNIHPLGGGLEIWFGYHQSLRLGQWSPMVNIDLTATAFYGKGPVLNFIADFLNIRDIHQISNIRDYDVSRINKEIKGLHVQVTHLKYKRKYRIVKMTRDAANRLNFEVTEKDKDGREKTRSTTVAQYFEKTYRRLEYPHLPCLQVHPERKNIFIPIEVCELIEGQHSRKKLDEKQTAEMIKFTAKPPKMRFNEIRDSIKRAAFNQDACANDFGVKVSNEPLSLEGRVIEAPNVRYLERQIKPRDGSWDMRDTRYFRGAVIKSWVLLSFANPRFCNDQQLDKFAKLLCNIARDQGIEINRPETIEIIDTRRQRVQNVITQMYQRYKCNLAVVVVPAMNKSVYGEVKQTAETMLGLTTQCIKEESVCRKCTPPLVSNLCQKINAKMGGINNSLTPGETPPILRKPVIIIGADVTHPGPSHEIKPSIAACVGSLDAHPSRYAVSIRAQTNVNENKESIEMILDLKNMVIELLKAFYRHTRGKKPEKIIFYRDGVSEGQFSQVRRHEVKCIRDACTTLSPDYKPEITFIIVQKRHHVRFMPQDDRSGVGKMRNIPPGTTVDNTVVHPLNFDFFLCSHFGLQGTSRPCHYTVVEDDNNFTADDLQKLTYYLCHTYVRCTKSISSPAPVQYAHLAAFRARQHLLTQIDESSACSTSSGSSAYHPLPDAVLNAIKVVEGLKDTMYFV